MPSKRRVELERRRRGEKVVEDSKRLAFGSRPVTLQEELEFLAFQVDRLLVEDSLERIPVCEPRPRVVVVVVC